MLHNLIQQQINSVIDNLYTTLPASVVRVYEHDNGGTVVDVQIGVNKVFRNDLSAQMEPVLREVPLVWPSSSGCYITTPINEGDTVMLNFSMRNAAEWFNSDGTSPTTALMQQLHGVNSVFATPAMLPYGKAPSVDSTGVKIASRKASIHIGQDGSVTIDSDKIKLSKQATESVILGDKFMALYNNLIAALKLHTHPVTGAKTEASAELTPIVEMTSAQLSSVTKTK